MNEVIRQLHARKSVRAFEDREIPQEIKNAILEAACQAATAGNQQLYTIVSLYLLDNDHLSKCVSGCLL